LSAFPGLGKRFTENATSQDLSPKTGHETVCCYGGRVNERVSSRLLESEKRFRLMADTTPALVWMCDSKGDVTYLNERRINFTGRDQAAGLGDVWSAFIHPDDLQSVWAANARALEQQKGFSKEYRLRRRDGEYRWMLDIAAPRIDGDGSFVGFIGSAADITDQKLVLIAWRGDASRRWRFYAN
jgi:PAS domain S-box-containing protein